MKVSKSYFELYSVLNRLTFQLKLPKSIFSKVDFQNRFFLKSILKIDFFLKSTLEIHYLLINV
jgi:hypothetical protein